jgi:hypothetical protein
MSKKPAWRNVGCPKYDECLQRAALADSLDLGCLKCERRHDVADPAGLCADNEGELRILAAVFFDELIERRPEWFMAAINDSAALQKLVVRWANCGRRVDTQVKKYVERRLKEETAGPVSNARALANEIAAEVHEHFRIWIRAETLRPKLRSRAR